jgi:hypothetical protein
MLRRSLGNSSAAAVSSLSDLAPFTGTGSVNGSLLIFAFGNDNAATSEDNGAVLRQHR